jgi:hypothetical protein
LSHNHAFLFDVRQLQQATQRVDVLWQTYSAERNKMESTKNIFRPTMSHLDRKMNDRNIEERKMVERKMNPSSVRHSSFPIFLPSFFCRGLDSEKWQK